MELNRTGHSHSGQSSYYENKEEKAKSTISTWNDHNVQQMSAPQTNEAGLGTFVLWLLKTAGEAVIYLAVNLVIDSQSSNEDEQTESAKNSDDSSPSSFYSREELLRTDSLEEPDEELLKDNSSKPGMI